MSLSVESRPVSAPPVRRTQPAIAIGRPTRTTTWTAVAVAAVFAAIYLIYSLGRHRAFATTGFDLGIFEQAVGSYAHGHWPTSTIRAPGLNLLGDHFHPILAVLAPFYRLFPSAETLLVAQALLLAASVLPITRIACSMMGRWLGVTIGVAYGLSWGLQNTLRFDFHEVAFAVPLLAFALEKLLRGRYSAAVAIATPIVLVKEDLGLTLAALGVLLALYRPTRRLGVCTALAGAATTALTVLVVIPAFSADGNYQYLHAGGVNPYGVVHGDRLDPSKLVLLVLLLLPTAFIALRSPLLLLALPTLAWRLLGTYEFYWTPMFHYDAVLMPILFCALVHGLVLLRPRLMRVTRGTAASPWARAFLGAVLVMLGPFAGTPTPLRDPAFNKPPEYAAAAKRLMAHIPDGATVATENVLAPQLTSRTTVYLLPHATETDWILAFANQPATLCPLLATADQVHTDGWLVLIHRGPAPTPLTLPGC
ncbi:DUF2079 domain-containing protein [Kribbella sp. NPDC056861]|uniref:DUF2079 domain-containing protein n=1 Tax=Kribbella sp. NPDC056861 TaxID=3154857 RepID=UPI003438D523